MNKLALPVLAAAFGALAVGEAINYFRDPVAPDERSMPWTDPTRVPEAMARDCRQQGLQLVATKTDGPDWVYDCLEVRR